MNRWRGLFKKEWMLMKSGIFTYVLLTIFIVMIGPAIISRLFGVPKDFFDNTLVLGGVWLGFGAVIGCSVLLVSLGKDMKQPEIWLHSPLPISELVGVKAVFAALTTISSLLLNGILLIISFFFSDAFGKDDISDGLLSLLSAIISLFLHSIYLMAIGFFFWSIYRVLRSRIGEISLLVAFALFVLAGIAWEKLRVAGLFRTVSEFIPIKITSITFYNEQSSYFFTGIVPEGIITSIGSLLFYGTLTVVLFAMGAMLFEKKVRL